MMRNGVLICMHDLFFLAIFRLLLLKMKGVLKVEHKGFAFPLARSRPTAWLPGPSLGRPGEPAHFPGLLKPLPSSLP